MTDNPVDSQQQQKTTGGQKIKKCPQCNAEYSGNEIVCPKDRTMLLAPQKDELIGQILNERYKVVEEVGRGGMSAVYKGVHELMDRTVAIKVLLPQLVSDQISIKRFQQEAQAASHLQHPNVITVYDYGFVANGQPYLVMDFLEGESLSDIIKRDKQVNVKRMIPIFMQACEALEHAHQKGVIHRDLKSSNIMLIDFEGKKDFVKVVDFGIAKLMPSSGKQSQNLTQTGEVFGSPIYMSPEQCMAQSLDARSDIYSMGAMMYEGLTGQPPLMGNSIIDTMQMHMSTPPKPFKEMRPDLSIPDSLERVVLKALAKKPEHRFQSMQELRDALDGVSKLMDKEKLFGPGPVGRAGRGNRARLTSQRPATQPSGAAAGAGKSSAPSAGQDKSPPKVAEPVGRKSPPPEAARTTPKKAPEKPRKVVGKSGGEDGSGSGASPLDQLMQLKDLKLFGKVPALYAVLSVVGALVLTATVTAVSSLNLPKLFSTESETSGMVYYYKPATQKRAGALSLYTSSEDGGEDEEPSGKLIKLVLPEGFNMDDYAGMAEGVSLGDIWHVTAHPRGNDLILDKPEFVDEKKNDGEDLRQVVNLVKRAFGMITAQTTVDPSEVATCFMPEWSDDDYKLLLKHLDKEGLEYNLVADANAVPKSYMKVEFFDRDQGKASILLKTNYWIKKGPRYMRVLTIKKDGKKWLIAQIDEISPKIWREDGVRQDVVDGEEGEGEEEEE